MKIQWRRSAEPWLTLPRRPAAEMRVRFDHPPRRTPRRVSNTQRSIAKVPGALADRGAPADGARRGRAGPPTRRVAA